MSLKPFSALVLCTSATLVQPSGTHAIEPNLDFSITDEASYQAFVSSISKTEYARFEFSKAPKPRVISAVAGLLHYVTANPLATSTQQSDFLDSYSTALGLHATDDSNLERVSHLITATRFELPLSGNPTLDGTDTNFGEDVADYLQLRVAPPTDFLTNENRMANYEYTRAQLLGNSKAWSDLLLIGFMGRDLLGNPNDHVATVLEDFLVAEGYSPIPSVIETEPEIIGSILTPTAWDVIVDNNIASVSTSAGIYTIDVGNPSSPQNLGNVSLTYNATDLALDGNTLFVANTNNGMQVIDISNPASPSITTTASFLLSLTGLELDGTIIYGAELNPPSLQVVDVNDPATPTAIASLPLVDFPQEIAIQGDYLYLAHRTEGMKVIDISNPMSPTIVGSVDTPSYAIDITINGNLAFIADWDSGLIIVDISDPALPVIIGDIVTPGDAAGVAVMGDRAYIADNAAGFQTIDISDPTAPVLLSTTPTPNNAWSIFLSGNLAYVADKDSGLQIISLANDPVADGLSTLPPDFATYQSLLTSPFAPASLWDTIRTELTTITEETQNSLTELTNAVSPSGEATIPEAASDASSSEYINQRETEYQARLAAIADNSASLNANAMLLAQSTDPGTTDFADRTRELARLKLETNKKILIMRDLVQIVGGAANGGAYGGYLIADGAVGLADSATPGPTEEEQLYDEIVSMRMQMNSMHVQLNSRFDRIDTQFNVLYDSLFTGFDLIGTQIGDLQTNMDLALTSLEQLEYDMAEANAKLDRIEDALWTISVSQTKTDLALLANAILNYRAGSGDLPYQNASTNFVDEMSDLYTYATTTAIDDVYAGDPGFTLTVANAQSTLTDNSIGRHINHLRAFPPQIGLPEIRPFRSPSPTLWAQISSAYHQVAQESPWYFARLYSGQIAGPGTPELDQIIAVGQELENLATATRNQAMFDELLEGWDTELQTIDSIVNSEIVSLTKRGSYEVPDLNAFTPGSGAGIDAQGDYAYLCEVEAGLRIYDISDPNAPTPVGLYNTPGEALDVVVRGDLAYIADADRGLRIVNVSSPATPFNVGTYDTPGYAMDIAVSGDIAIIADSTSGAHFIDVSNPASPTLLYSLASHTRQVVARGNIVLTTREDNRVNIVDLDASTTYPVVTGTLYTSGDPKYLAINDDATMAYVMTSQWGLMLFDIAIPTFNIYEVSYLQVFSHFEPAYTIGTEEIVWLNDIILWCGGTSGLYAVDVSIPSAPVVLDYDRTSYSRNAKQVTITGDQAVLMDYRWANHGTWDAVTVVDLFDTNLSVAFNNVASELDTNPALDPVKTNLRGYQKLIESFITLGMPELMEESTIVRAALRSDPTIGDISLGSERELALKLRDDGGATGLSWSQHFDESFALLRNEISDAITSPKVGHAYIDYMLAELEHLRDTAFELANDDSYLATTDETLVVPPGEGLLVNDIPQEYRTLEAETLFAGYIPPSNGSVTVFADGSLEYIPNLGFSGTDSFTYRAYTEIPTVPVSYAYSNPATVVIRVAEPETPPCDTDLNEDGVTNGSDLGLFLANWGNPGQTDLDGNGSTNGADLGLFLAAWGPCL